MKPIGRREVGGLHEKMVAPVADSEQIPFPETFLEQVVNHVLGAKVQRQATFIVFPKILESRLQVPGLVGDILHDVRGQPDRLHPQSLVTIQNRKRLLHRPDSVIDPRKDVRMAIRQTIENSTVTKGALFSKRPHIQLFFKQFWLMATWHCHWCARQAVRRAIASKYPFLRAARRRHPSPRRLLCRAPMTRSYAMSPTGPHRSRPERPPYKSRIP